MYGDTSDAGGMYHDHVSRARSAWANGITPSSSRKRTRTVVGHQLVGRPIFCKQCLRFDLNGKPDHYASGVFESDDVKIQTHPMHATQHRGKVNFTCRLRPNATPDPQGYTWTGRACPRRTRAVCCDVEPGRIQERDAKQPAAGNLQPRKDLRGSLERGRHGGLLARTANPSKIRTRTFNLPFIIPTEKWNVSA